MVDVVLIGPPSRFNVSLVFMTTLELLRYKGDIHSVTKLGHISLLKQALESGST